MSERTRRECQKAKCIYILKHLKKEMSELPRYIRMAPEDIACRSYIRSTYDDLIEALREKNEMTAEAIVSKYIEKVKKWSCKNVDISYMYSVAYDTAMDAYDQMFINPYF